MSYVKIIKPTWRAPFVLAVLLAGCSEGPGSMINPKGAIADGQLWHFYEVIAVTMIAVLPVLGLP